MTIETRNVIEPLADTIAYESQKYVEMITSLVARHTLISAFMDACGDNDIVAKHWIWNHAIRYDYSINVKREALPMLRRIVGRMCINGKTYAGTKHGKHYISVFLQPVDGPFKELTFEYEREHDANSKCKIVTNTHTSKSLVCDI